MAINRKKVIEDMSKIEVLGDKNGLIEAFNVYVNQLPISLWNNFADRLTAKVEKELLPTTEMLLVSAATSCGYHTGYGIITSEEWKAAVAPMVETTEDVLHGAFAVFTAWGWAEAEIVELIPGERMVVRAYDYYEADVVKFGHADKMSAYMIQGVCNGFMALAYSGEYHEKGAPIEGYTCTQVRGIECGDEYGEFIVEKN